MNRLFLVCAFLGLCVVGCSKTSDSANNTNKATPAVSPSVAATATTKPTQQTNTNTEKTDKTAQGDVTGAYFAKDDLPADFAEIEHLSLATIDENAKPAPLNGFIRPKQRSAKDYKLVNPKLDGKNLTFTTTTENGVGYSFTGAFEKMGNFAEKPPEYDEVVLKGTLTKMKDGAKVAETKVNFTYSAGG